MKEHICRPTNDVYEILNDTDWGFEIIKEEIEDEDRERVQSLKEELKLIKPVQPPPEPPKTSKVSVSFVRAEKRNYCQNVVRRISHQL